MASAWAAVAAGLLSVFTGWLDHLHKKAEGGSTLAQLLVENDWLLIGFLGATATLASLYAAFVTGHSARLTCAVVEYLHRRAFPSPSHKDDDYRVSLYVPMRRASRLWARRLWCQHRTDGRLPRRAWDPEGADGLVAAVYQSRSVKICRGLSSNALAAVKKRRFPWPSAVANEIDLYIEQTRSTADLICDTSWGGAAMVGLPVLKGPTMECIGVLLVERRTALSEIQLTSELFADATLCAIILEEGIWPGSG